MESKINVCWEDSIENNDGYYDEDDDPDKDYPNEVYHEPTWSTYRYIEKRDSSEIRKIFSEEDGDCDFSHQINFITDRNHKLLFAIDKIKNREEREEKEKYLCELLEVNKK